MSNKLDKTALGIIVFLLLALIVGGVKLGMKTIGHKPTEIIIGAVNSTPYNYEINISGAVINPGIYKATENDTVTSLLNSAGLNPEADKVHLNIYVPRSTEMEEPQKININTAPVWLLQALPDIGEEKAQNIINYRQTNGKFKNIYELQKVDGIGRSTFEKIKDFITVGY